MSLRQYMGQQNEQQMFGVACVGDDFWCSSACLELDQTAQIISYEEYHPFGTTSYRSGRTETEVSLKRYKYVGKERDEKTGLYYNGARYYAAWLCKFVSVDPLQFEYPYYTPYQYAGNKPISYIDLDGLEEAKKDKPKINPSIQHVYRINGSYQGSVVWGDNKGFATSSDGKNKVNMTQWGSSFMLTRQKIENKEMMSTIIRDDNGNYGYFFHDTSRNQRDESFVVPEQTVINGQSFLEINGKQYKVVAIIHSHPDDGLDKSGRASNSDGSFADKYNVPNYIISDYMISKINSYDEWWYESFNLDGSIRASSAVPNDFYKIADIDSVDNGLFNIISDIEDPKHTIASIHKSKVNVK